ncbi:hypothetical protein ALQ64_102507 [Pseudomonas cannabina]|uniref:Uncharacterized protein n=1 Tax=Pseudomonas cannabina TaxID=86840 RepID=A0A0P9L0Y0_PSECA|nr:hypothetical protein ALO81_102262 [Pseudomonas cannabina]RMN39607.1 hypothetical protein ALQ64_102507 [Pseudomonas cannabina]
MTAAAIRIAHKQVGAAAEYSLISQPAFASKLAPTSEHHPVGVAGAAIRIAHEGAGTANEDLLNN